MVLVVQLSSAGVYGRGWPPRRGGVPRHPGRAQKIPAFHCRNARAAADVYCLLFLCRESTGLGGPLNEEEFHVVQGVLDLGIVLCHACC
jgi:hypothetical protein